MLSFYREQAQATAGDLAVVNLSMHAALAVDYFAAHSLEQYEQALQLTKDRHHGGIGSEVSKSSKLRRLWKRRVPRPLTHLAPETVSKWTHCGDQTVVRIESLDQGDCARHTPSKNIHGGGWDRSELPQHPECCGQLASGSD